MGNLLKAASLLLLALSLHGKEAPKEPPPFVVHEWGVFKVGKDKTATLATGGGPPPTFVSRVKIPEGLFIHKDGEEPGVAFLPVIHIYGLPGPASVRVTFPTGRPLLAWPTPQVLKQKRGREEEDRYAALRWQVRPPAPEGDSPVPKVPDDHWIGILRKAGSDPIVTQAYPQEGDDFWIQQASPQRDREQERFLYYDAEVDYERDVTAVPPAKEGGEFVVTFLGFGPHGPERRQRFIAERPGCAWILQASKDGRLSWFQAIPSREDDTNLQPRGKLEPVEEKTLRKEMLETLTVNGLTGAEADALLRIWMPDIVKPGTRLIYMMPEESYCRILPIEVKPAPKELVRVGLVIDELAATRPPGP